MKVAVFFSAGLGDALLLVPLLKAIKKSGRVIEGIFDSRYVDSTIFDNTDLLDSRIDLHCSNIKAWRYCFAHIGAFDEIYLNHLAATKRNLLMGRIMGGRLITNFIGRRKILLMGSCHRFVEPKVGIHDALQNFRMWDPSADQIDIKEMFVSAFNEKSLAGEKFSNNIQRAPTKPYVLVQLSAANCRAAYKNWPIDYWHEWLRLATNRYPRIEWLLVGQASEAGVANEVMRWKIPRVVSLVGQTSFRQLKSILKETMLFVGLDSGLLHLAVTMNKPTFTIWGGSDPMLYGYHSICPMMHAAVYFTPSCGPCNSWIQPNLSRVKCPTKCPDVACMKALTPSRVFMEFEAFISRLSVDEQTI